MKKRYYTPKRALFTLRLDKKTIWTEQELLNLPPSKFAEVIEKFGSECTFFRLESTVKYGSTSVEEVYRAQQGDQKIRNKIINDNIGLLVKILNSLLPSIGVRKGSDQWKEFIQLGRMALDRAIDTFDTARTDTSFGTWSHIIVRNQYISYWGNLQKQKEREVSLSTPVGEDEEGGVRTLEDVLEDPKANMADLQLAQDVEEIKRILSPIAWEIFKGKMDEMAAQEIAQILKDKGFHTQRGTEYTVNNISEILHNTIKPIMEKVFGRKIASTTLFAEGEPDLIGVEEMIAKLRGLVLKSLKKK